MTRPNIENHDQNRAQYWALSHSWRDASDIKDPVQINGWRVELNRNIIAAILQLGQDGHDVFWIDTICINQENEDEKSAQVIHMADIYTYAWRVCAWVGLDNGDWTERAIACLGELGTQPLDTLSEEFRNECLEITDKFIARSWFERLWVIQEVTLGADQAIIQCGRFGLPYATALAAFRQIYSLWVTNGQPPVDNSAYHIAWRTQHFVAAEEILARTQQGQKVMPFNLAMKLARMDHLGVSDDRDRIWGLLGLLPERYRYEFWPDYERVEFWELEAKAMQLCRSPLNALKEGEITQEELDHAARLNKEL